jgi:hypothetical protein
MGAEALALAEKAVDTADVAICNARCSSRSRSASSASPTGAKTV